MIKTIIQKISLFILSFQALQGQSLVQSDVQQAQEDLQQQAKQSVIVSSKNADSSMALSSKKNGFNYTQDGLPIFGSQLFQGDFKNLSFTGFNPDYQIGIGDVIQIMLWGAQENNLDLTVDAQGNVFIPKVGPVAVQGVRNADINKLINDHIRQIYKENIDAYANLRSTQTVKVYASGAVVKPGLYQGCASDSILYFLDRAGGIDPDRGSYLNISILRQGKSITVVNLYDFLEKGSLPITQFHDGDVILVGPRGNSVIVQGDVNNSGRFEFSGSKTSLSHLLSLASPKAESTSANIRRSRLGAAEAIILPLDQADKQQIEPGDIIEVTGHSVIKSILVTISGEYEGAQNIVLPYGAVLAEALHKITASPRSNLPALQIFRKSVAERQKILLQQSLDNLERTVFSAQSSSLEEAKLRQTESEMTLDFIKRARAVEPKGQVLLESLSKADEFHLEDGDILYIPLKTSLVNISGEVKFPNTQTYRIKDSIEDYIDRAGGYTLNANTKELILIRPNGEISSIGRGYRANLTPGDEIIVLPKPDKKSILFAKDISTIMYQIAIATRVVIGL